MNKFTWLMALCLLPAQLVTASAKDAATCPGAPAGASEAAPSDPDALLRLGDLYYDGNAVGQNYRQAFYYYDLAAKAGNSIGKLRVGEMTALGLGVAQDVEKGRKLVKQVADGGSQSALVSLGDLYARGNAGPMDPALALAAYQKAAQAGNARAMLKLAEIYRYGRFKPVDRKTALNYYKMAAAAGNDYGLLGQGGMYLEGYGGSAKAGLELLDKAAKRGVEDAVVKVANSYFVGDGVPRNAQKALALLNDAAAAGNMTAAQELVASYRDGKLSRNKFVFSKNAAKARATLKSFAGKLDKKDYQAESFLLDVATSGLKSYGALYDRMLAFPAELRMSVYRETRSAHLNFYTYATQRRLKELGIYKGQPTGKLDKSTILAMIRECKSTGTSYFCSYPPATGYYGEILSYDFRTAGKNADECPPPPSN